MNYLVIGEPCVDVISTADGKTVHSYGGILYSIISMAILSRDRDTIIPIMNLGQDEFENVLKIFSKYPKIKTYGVNKVKHPTRKVFLYYNLYNSDKKARVEKSSEPTYTLDYLQCENFLNMADAILVNMISGTDISLDSLKTIRKNFKKYIHIDIHNIVMETKDDGSRVHTNVDDWYEWCTNADTVQMNEFEIATLSREKLKAHKIAEEILFNKNHEVKGLIVTKGKDGVTGYTKKKKFYAGEEFYDIEHHEFPSIENPHFVDSTGCGDIFASAFTLDYSVNNDFEKSLHYANRMASLNASLEGIDELYKLK